MTIPVGINGFGRIGRMVFRILYERRDRFQVVGVNDLGDAKTMAHLLKYDSTQRIFDADVSTDGSDLVVGDWRIPMWTETDPGRLPWKDHDQPLVLESTGVFRKRAQLEAHLRAGASKVLLTVPPKDELDALVVLGVNGDTLRPEHRLVSNASCTTNCLAPVAKVVHESFGIVRGLMNTIHAYTNDQRILDLPHKDLRRARSAAINIIPTTTGAARAVGKVIPALHGKLDGFAVRVPVATGSIVDLTVELEREATIEQLNGAMKKAAEGPLRGILRYTEDPLVSTDIQHDPHSSIFDAGLTLSMGTFAKVCAWYDNEWGYSSRCADLLERLAVGVPAAATR